MSEDWVGIRAEEGTVLRDELKEGENGMKLEGARERIVKYEMNTVGIKSEERGEKKRK